MSTPVPGPVLGPCVTLGPCVYRAVYYWCRGLLLRMRLRASDSNRQTNAARAWARQGATRPFCSRAQPLYRKAAARPSSAAEPFGYLLVRLRQPGTDRAAVRQEEGKPEGPRTPLHRWSSRASCRAASAVRPARSARSTKGTNSDYRQRMLGMARRTHSPRLRDSLVEEEASREFIARPQVRLRIAGWPCRGWIGVRPQVPQPALLESEASRTSYTRREHEARSWTSILDAEARALLSRTSSYTRECLHSRKWGALVQNLSARTGCSTAEWMGTAKDACRA